MPAAAGRPGTGLTLPSALHDGPAPSASLDHLTGSGLLLHPPEHRFSSLEACGYCTRSARPAARLRIFRLRLAGPESKSEQEQEQEDEDSEAEYQKEEAEFMAYQRNREAEMRVGRLSGVRGGWCVGTGRRPRFYNVATQIEPRSSRARRSGGRRAQASVRLGGAQRIRRGLDLEYHRL